MFPRCGVEIYLKWTPSSPSHNILCQRCNVTVNIKQSKASKTKLNLNPNIANAIKTDEKIVAVEEVN